MSKIERALWGGSGAIVTIVLGLIHVRPEAMFADFAFIVFLGWLVRTAILFAAGALSVMFYENITNRIMLFQLGAAAPTILAGILSAPFQEPPPPPVAVPSAIEEKAEQSFVFGVNNTAYAAIDTEQTGIPIHDFASDKEKYIETGIVDAFFRGFTNKPEDPRYLFYVVVDDGYPDAKAANDVAHHVLKDVQRSSIFKSENLTVEVYAPFKDKIKNYTIVAGARLGEAPARHLLSEMLIWDYTEAKIFELNCECYPFGDSDSRTRAAHMRLEMPPALKDKPTNETDGAIIQEVLLIREDIRKASERLDRLEDLVARAIAVSAKGRKTAREGDLEIIRRLSTEIGALKRRIDSLESRSRLPD